MCFYAVNNYTEPTKKKWSEKLDNNGLRRLAGALCCRLHLLHSMYISINADHKSSCCMLFNKWNWLINLIFIYFHCTASGPVLAKWRTSFWPMQCKRANFIGREIGRLIYLFQENIPLINFFGLNHFRMNLQNTPTNLYNYVF